MRYLHNLSPFHRATNVYAMHKTVLLTIISFSAVMAYSQRSKDTSINKEQKIIQKYEPKLIAATKIESVPVMEKPVSTPPVYTYTIQPEQTKTDKIINPIPATDLFMKEENNFPSSFIKLGYGNMKTPLAELYFNNKQDNKYSYGMHYRFLQTNSKDNNSFADYTDHAVKGYLASYTSSGEFGLEANYKYNKYNYYGYVDTNTKAENNLARSIRNFEARAYYNSTPAKNDKIKHRTAFGFYNYQIDSATENDYNLSTRIYGNVSDFNNLENGVLSATIGVDYTTLQQAGMKMHKRVFIQIDPRFDFKYDVLDLSVGFNSTIFFDGNDTAKLFPNLYIKATYPLIQNVAYLYGGIDGHYIKRSVKSIIQTNQFTSAYNITNSYENVKLFAGINGKVGSAIDAQFEINYLDVSKMPLFISNKDSLNSFVMVLDQVNITKFGGAVNYSFSEKARIGLSGNFYNYETTDQPLAWQLPNIEGKLNMNYNFNNKIYPHVDIIAMSKQNQRTGASEKNYTQSSIKAFYDISAGIDFRFREKLSIFVQANNVLSNRYQRWYNYPVYGFNAVGGLTFIF